MTVPFSNVSGSTSITASEFSLPANTTSGVPTAQTTAIKRPILRINRVGVTVAGDQFNLVVYDKVGGGTQHPLFTFSLDGATTEIDVFDLPSLAEGWDITLKMISASARTLGWSIYEDVGDANVAAWNGSAPANLDGSGNVPVSSTIAAAIKAKTDNLPSDPASESLIIAATNAIASAIAALPTASAIAAIASAVSALPSAAANAAAVLATTVEGTVTVGRALRGLVRTVFAAKRDGYDTGTVHVRDLADSKNSHTIVTTSTGWTSVTLNDLD